MCDKNLIPSYYRLIGVSRKINTVDMVENKSKQHRESTYPVHGCLVKLSGLDENVWKWCIWTKTGAENIKHRLIQFWIIHWQVFVLFFFFNEQHFLHPVHIFLDISKINLPHTQVHTQWWENDLGHLVWICYYTTAQCIIEPLLNLYCFWKH